MVRDGGGKQYNEHNQYRQQHSRSNKVERIKTRDKHVRTLILLKKLIFMSNFNVFILMFVIFFNFSFIALILHS